MTRIDDLDGLTKDFAAACYDDNSIQELRDALNGEVDVIDCNNWEITPDKWRLAITAALNDLEGEQND